MSTYQLRKEFPYIMCYNVPIWRRRESSRLCPDQYQSIESRRLGPSLETEGYYESIALLKHMFPDV
jgi:hypothetical protein